MMKARRGLSTIIGAVFMVIVMIGALNVTLWTMQQQDSIADVVAEKNSASLDRLNERIDISDVRIDGDKFNLTVSNSGGRATELGSLYLVNENASPKEQYRYDLTGTVVDSRQSVSSIGTDSSVPFSIDTSARYTAKVVTVSGNSAAMRMASPSDLDLKLALYVIPPSITTGQDVTLLFAVTNDSTDSLAYAVTPVITPNLSCTPYPSDNCKTTKTVSAETGVLIPKGSTYLFKEVYNVKGPIGTTITFTATLQNGDPSNFVVETGSIQAVNAANIANTFLFARLIQQPEIEAIFPSPFGVPSNAAAQGLWGAIVANPTESTMHVRKVVITVFSPRTQSQDQIIRQSGSSCANTPTAILPASGGSWSCPATNTLVWTASGSALSIQPHDAQPFLITIGGPSLPNGGGDLQSYQINYNVFTDYGQFAKTGYDGAMRTNTGAIANVFLSTVAESKDPANMLGKITVTQGQTVTVKASIADLDPDTGTKIDAGTKLVIDIPQDFTDVSVLPATTGFDVPCEANPFSDGSTQISCAVSADLTGAAGAAVRTIQFTMTAPSVDKDKLYVLYLLADGTSNNGAFIVGPVSEYVIRVTET